MRIISKFLLSLLVISFTQLGFAADHKYNVRVDPLGLLFGAANIGMDFAVNDNWTVGGGLTYSSLSSGNTKASAFGVEARAQYFFEKVFTDSWYVAPYASHVQGTGESGNTTNVSVSVTSIGAIAGYMWIWDNFNIQLGGGFRQISVNSDTNTTTFDTLSGFLPAIEFNLGYAF